ncbi:MAG: serine acetyltransferase [Mariprofundaceae bacterium]|nr:serine acetyltransferase [Mariprofundaceae bacterium]
MMKSNETDMSNNLKSSLFQDWDSNKGNIKGRIIMLAFRIANFLSHIPRPFYYFGYPYVILYRVVVEWILCVELPWKLKVGGGLRLYHGQALVVHDRAVIGRNCVLRHSTTIGVAGTFADYGGVAPIIGNDVDIGSNVVILGDISIGDGAVIGAGSVVVKSVESGVVVVGNPAHVIRVISKVGANVKC